MLIEANIVPQCLAEPGSLGGLLTLYEGNYLKLRQLLPEPAILRGDYRSQSPRDLPLHLSVAARTRYTMDAALTYVFEDAAGRVADPDLQLRLYFDARMVEVVGWSGFARHRELRRLSRAAARELDLRWARNAMLGKWLDYLLEHGHRFHGLSVPSQTVD